MASNREISTKNKQTDITHAYLPTMPPPAGILLESSPNIRLKRHFWVYRKSGLKRSVHKLLERSSLVYSYPVHPFGHFRPFRSSRISPLKRGLHHARFSCYGGSQFTVPVIPLRVAVRISYCHYRCLYRFFKSEGRMVLRIIPTHRVYCVDTVSDRRGERVSSGIGCRAG